MERASRGGYEPMKKHVLVICSGGGHWIQMKRILPAFNGHSISLATVDVGGVSNIDVDFETVTKIPDFNRKNLFAATAFLFSSLKLIYKLRPTHIVSTGAAPGIIALVIGRLIGSKSLWIDSIANAKKLSVSGRIACIAANQVFTQWEHLNGKNGAKYVGKVI